MNSNPQPRLFWKNDCRTFSNKPRIDAILNNELFSFGCQFHQCLSILFPLFYLRRPGQEPKTPVGITEALCGFPPERPSYRPGWNLVYLPFPASLETAEAVLFQA